MQDSSDRSFCVSVVSVEEQLRGWLAAIHRLREFHEQIHAYQQLVRLLDFIREWHIIPFDTLEANESQRLKKLGVRIGTQDLKIGATAIVHNAILLSANLKDFRRVPGLRLENWLE